RLRARRDALSPVRRPSSVSEWLRAPPRHGGRAAVARLGCAPRNATGDPEHHRESDVSRSEGSLPEREGDGTGARALPDRASRPFAPLLGARSLASLVAAIPHP